MSDRYEPDAPPPDEASTAADAHDGDGLGAAWSRRWPWIAGIAGAAVVAYGTGRIQGAIGESAVRDEAASRIGAEEKEKATLATELGAAEEAVAVLRARRNLDRAARALTEHNYGLAQERVKAAAKLLAGREGFADLAGRLEKMNVLVPGESERLSGELRGAIDAFDAVWDKRSDE